MPSKTISPKRPVGRPNTTPAGRDQLGELTHLRAWWNAHKQDLPPLARLAREAGVTPRYARHVLSQAVPNVTVLDKLYVPLRRFGYQPLPHARWAVSLPTPEPAAPTSPSGATFDWFNPLAAQQA